MGAARRRAGSGKPPEFLWVNTTDEIEYLRLARKLWVEWSKLDRTSVFSRSRRRAHLRKSQKGDRCDELHPEALRCLEQICHARTASEVRYPEQWKETLDHTLRGFLGRQPGQRRDLGVELPDFLFPLSYAAEPKHGTWHWLLVGDALAGAIGADGLHDEERSAALERLRKATPTIAGRGRPPIEDVVATLAQIAAGPPRMGVRALVVLGRLSQAREIRDWMNAWIPARAPMFRLFRAFTIMLADTATATEEQTEGQEPDADDEELRNEEQEQRGRLANSVLETRATQNPYGARSLRPEMLATISDDRFGHQSENARRELWEYVEENGASWRERSYAGEVLTRPSPKVGPAMQKEATDRCLEAWRPGSEELDPVRYPSALAHAAAVIVERQLMDQGLKRAVGARVTKPVTKPPKDPDAELSRDATVNDVCERAAEVYGADHWILQAIKQDPNVRGPVEEPIRRVTEELAKKELVRLYGDGLRRTSDGDKPVYEGKRDHTVWMDKYNGIAGRIRFLCEEAVLSIAGTTRRRSVDCLAVSGLGGFASDVLLDAIVMPELDPGGPAAEEEAHVEAPLWVQELAAWAVGFLRRPNESRLVKLAKAANCHIDAIETLDADSREYTQRVAVAHAALWAIGDSAGLEEVGAEAASKPEGEVSKALERALGLGHGPEIAPIRWAAAYTLRYCLPRHKRRQLSVGDAERDSIVKQYADMDLRFL